MWTYPREFLLKLKRQDMVQPHDLLTGVDITEN